VNPLRSTATALLLAATAPAQNPLAYPQASTASLSGNFTPLGFSSIGAGNEGRYQVLIPADHLPGRPALIRAIECYTIVGTGPVTYSSLSIRIGSILGAPVLSTSFTANLASSVQVWAKTQVTLQWTERQWVRIALGTPYAYDGTSNLVLDFQKVVAPTTGIPLVSHATARRAGVVPAVYIFGPTGSGASQATSARFSSPNPLLVRLIVDTPTLSLSSPPIFPNYLDFAIGGPVDIAVHAAPNQVHWTLLANGFSPIGVTRPPVAGTLFLDLAGVSTLATGVVPATGEWSTQLTIPNDPGLVGLQFALQSAVAGPNLGQPTWTNASDFFVNL